MRMQHRRLLLTGGAVSLALIAALMVQAAGDGDPTRGIPYRGKLEFNGTPPSGIHDLTFSLFDDSTAGSELFTETLSVNIFQGNFETVIGRGTLPDSVYTAAELYARIEVDGTELAGRQQIFATHRSVAPPGRHSAGHMTLGSNLVPGLGGWGIAMDLDGDFPAIRHPTSTLQLGFHSTGVFYFSDNLAGTGTLDHFFWLEEDGDVFADGTYNGAGLALSNHPAVTEIQSGTWGNCAVNNSLPTNSLHNFPEPFSAVPTVVVTPGEIDDAGCTQVRITSVSTTQVRTRSYTLDAASSCGCIHYIAMVQ